MIILGIILVLFALAVGFLFLSGIVNSRKEEEYWDEVWHDTPTTDVSLFSDVSRKEETDSESVDLPKAA